MKIELTSDQINDIVIEDLTGLMSIHVKDLEKVKRENRGYAFSIDPKEDIKELSQLINSMARVLKYYRGD